METYTEIPISKETRKTLSISSKDALLHHLNDIKQGVDDLQVYTKMPSNSGYVQLRNKIDDLLMCIKKYS